jgi:succinate dehydrogenase hydrophobic anchor subunit
MKTVLYIVIIILIIVFALFIGKTTLEGWHIHIERPITAILFILTIIAGWFNL